MTISFFIGVLAVLPYAPLLLSGDQVLRENLYSDYDSYQRPVRSFLKEELAAGRFPLWNPWIGCGIPIHATGQVSVAYPLMTPILFLTDANRALKASLFLHVILCYWGQYLLGRHLGLIPPAASVSGLIVAQGGFLTSHLIVGHVMHVFAYALLPWLLLGLCRVCKTPAAASTCFLTVPIAGLFLVGHPQLPYYGFLFGGLWIIASWIFGAASAHRIKAVCGIGIAVAVAILISSVQLLPTYELFCDGGGSSNRGTAKYAGEVAMEPVDLYRLFVPSLMGSPAVGTPEFSYPDFYHEKVCYLGFLTWILAILGLYSATPTNWPRGAGALVGLAITMGLGLSTPVYEFLGSAIPGFFWFRCPGRCLSFASILVGLLAGAGFDSLYSGTSLLRSRSALVVSAFLAIAVICAAIVSTKSAIWLYLEYWKIFAECHLKQELLASGAVILSAIAVCLFCSRLGPKLFLTSTVALLLTDLGYFNVRQITFETRTQAAAPAELVTTDRLFRFVERRKEDGYSRLAVRDSRLVPLAIDQRVAMVGTNEGGVLPRSVEFLFQSIESNNEALLNLSGCRFEAAGKEAEDWRINHSAKPRIRFLPEIDLEELQSLVPGESNVPNSSSNLPGAASIQVIVDQANKLELRVVNHKHGLLMVADTYYPGWTCTVDCAPIDISQVYGCFRAVPLPSGSHTVQFHYRPTSFKWGCNLSYLGLAIFTMLHAANAQYRPVASPSISPAAGP